MTTDTEHMIFVLDGAGWQSAEYLAGRLFPDNSLAQGKRLVRSCAEKSGGRIISRTHAGGGYKLTSQATREEVNRAVERLESQASAMHERSRAIRRFAAPAPPSSTDYMLGYP